MSDTNIEIKLLSPEIANARIKEIHAEVSVGINLCGRIRTDLTEAGFFPLDGQEGRYDHDQHDEICTYLEGYRTGLKEEFTQSIPEDADPILEGQKFATRFARAMSLMSYMRKLVIPKSMYTEDHITMLMVAETSKMFLKAQADEAAEKAAQLNEGEGESDDVESPVNEDDVVH